MPGMTTARTGRIRGDRRPRRGLSRFGREIAVILVVKTIALFAIWQLWFAAPSRPEVDPQRIAERIYSSGSAATPAEARHARP
jgi:hypothetical protein